MIKGTKITMQPPKLTGYTSDSRPYEFTADTAAQDINKPDLVELQQLHAQLQMEDKSTVEMTAPSGLYDMKAEMLMLNEDIVLASSTGYAARLQRGGRRHAQRQCGVGQAGRGETAQRLAQRQAPG